MADDSPGGPRSAPARSARKRVWTLFVAALFLLPFAVAVAQFWALRRDQWEAQAAAQTQLASPAPSRSAWGVLGGIRLEQGRIAEALPLLEKASSLEAIGGTDTRDSLALAKANIEGVRKGLPGASLAAAAAALLRAEALASRLAKGKQAATWFSAGLFWADMGRPADAVASLKIAVALQPDDWVDEGNGLRYKSAGLASYYQQMLAGASER